MHVRLWPTIATWSVPLWSNAPSKSGRRNGMVIKDELALKRRVHIQESMSNRIAYWKIQFSSPSWFVVRCSASVLRMAERRQTVGLGESHPAECEIVDSVHECGGGCRLGAHAHGAEGGAGEDRTNKTDARSPRVG